MRDFANNHIDHGFVGGKSAGGPVIPPTPTAESWAFAGTAIAEIPEGDGWSFSGTSISQIGAPQ